MTGLRSREILRHKRILFAVRLVFLVLVGSLALPDFVRGTIPTLLPILLGVYLLTNAAMAFERSQVFFSQRVQATLIFFDLVVLVIAMLYLERYREDLFLAMFLVMLLASAGQRLSVSIGGCIAVAGLYVGFTMQDKGGFDEALRSLATVFPVLLVVAIYVGYVSESVARERRRREEADQRLHRELQGMDRLLALSSEGLMARDPEAFFASLAGTAADLLNAPAAVFWKPKDGSAFRRALSPAFPEPLASRWGADLETLERAACADQPLRLSPPHPWLEGLESALLAPFADRADGSLAILAVGWERGHEALRAEDDAVQALARTASLCLENASLYRMLSQTRDVWQAAFQSVPDPVVIVDGDARIVQANAAFMALGGLTPETLVGSSFAAMLEGAVTAGGRPLDGSASARMSIPRLGGDFDVARGPYQGETKTGAGSVWILRKVVEDVTASGSRTSDS